MGIRAVVDDAAAKGLTPRRSRSQVWGNLTRAFSSNRKALVGLILFVFFSVLAIMPGVIAPYNPQAEIFPRGLPPSTAHYLGTTAYGQDIYSQLIWGTRNSLIIALVAGALATVISVVIGVSAAYLGGYSDGLLSLLTDVFLVIPTFPLVIVIAAYARSGNQTVLIVVLVITLWAFGARQLRSQTLSLRNRGFLEAARVRGERRLYIICVEVLPTMTSLIVASFLGTALYAVLTAAGLQFIGLGDANAQSWGTMLYWAENNEALQAGMPTWAIAPGLCIALLGTSFALMNYAFDEISNPALRPVRAARRRRSRPRLALEPAAGPQPTPVTGTPPAGGDPAVRDNEPVAGANQPAAREDQGAASTGPAPAGGPGHAA